MTGGKGGLWRVLRCLIDRERHGVAEGGQVTGWIADNAIVSM